MGLDSYRNGEFTQAHVLDWQIRTVFADGGAGVFVYAWTDEWTIFDSHISGWSFGLTAADRHPKPALRAVSDFYSASLYELRETPWPRVSGP